MKQKWSEVRGTHDECEGLPATDGIVSSICIDAFETDDEDAVGEVVAKVIRTKTGDVGVVYINNLARYEDNVQKVIKIILNRQLIAAEKEGNTIALALQLGTPYYQIEKVSRREDAVCDYCEGRGALKSHSEAEKTCVVCGGSGVCGVLAGMLWIVKEGTYTLAAICKHRNIHNPTCYRFEGSLGYTTTTDVQETSVSYGFRMIDNFFLSEKEAQDECDRRNKADKDAGNTIAES